MLIEVIAVIIIGLITGVLVNVLSDDLPLRRQVRAPRYVPDEKKGAIHQYEAEEAWEIVRQDDEKRPLVAWSGITAFLTGKRASSDGVRLSWRYPLAELLTIGLMLLVVIAINTNPDYDNINPIQLAIWLAYMVIFAVITVIDIEHKLILFVVIIPSLLLALVDNILTTIIMDGFYPPTIQEGLMGAALGFIVFFLMYNGGMIFTYVLGKLRGQKIDEVAFGYGDVMLATLSGLILGWRVLIFAMFITVFLGAIGALIYIISRRLFGQKYSAFTALPYGPYIVAGTVIMLLYREAVIEFLL